MRGNMRLARINQSDTANRPDAPCWADNRVPGMKLDGMAKKQGRWSLVAAAGAVVLVLAGGPVLAFDGQTSAAGPINPSDLSPNEALRAGARQYYSGDKTGALNTLQYAAENGQAMAAWKLGDMYAKGDGVPEDDYRAFQYYSQIVREHGEDRPDAPEAPFVASAFVALGSYYLDGIEGAVAKDEIRARRIFTHAASYFGDAAAQYHLGQMYQDSNGRMAVRWYNLAALKGHVGAQARLGETLYTLGSSNKKKARGLMWLTVARKQAEGQDTAWINDLHEQYFAVSEEPVREMARSLADSWIERNRPDMLTAQQMPTQ